ncbi:MAG: TIGR02281 family clan AA aspartic protease [Gammaproteobacteria bacterium]|nr:TIGR02281 family clan AA aspartic protease [Gammaproteobacteria bacterium]
MIIAAWILVVGLLTLAFTDVLDRQERPNRSIASNVSTLDGARIAEVTLLRNRAGHYVAEGEIDGQPADFLLDTGATLVSISASAAEALGLRRGASVSISTANGTAIAYRTVLDSVSLGEIRLFDVPALINTGAQGPEVLLGMSFLRQLEFTQKGRTLTLRQVGG